MWAIHTTLLVNMHNINAQNFVITLEIISSTLSFQALNMGSREWNRIRNKIPDYKTNSSNFPHEFPGFHL